MPKEQTTDLSRGAAHRCRWVNAKQQHGQYWAVFLLVAFWLLPTVASARNVLVLLDNDMDSTFSAELRSALSAGRIDSAAEIFIQEIPTDYEHLLNSGAPALTANLAANIRLRFSSGRMRDAITFDEIIAQGTASGRFLDDVPDLFPEARRSFFHITWTPETGTPFPSDIDPMLTFELVTQALPLTQHVVLFQVISNPDAELGPLEYSFEATWLSRYKDQFTFEIVNLLDASDDLIAHTQAMPENTVGLYVLYRDSHPPAPEFHAWLTMQDKLPLFGFFEHNIDQFTGGAVISAQKLANTILAKAHGSKHRFTATDTIQKIINYDGAQRWGIALEALPSDIEVRGIPDTDVDRELVYIVIGIALLVILGLIAALLLISRARLKLERERWAEMAEHAAEQSSLIDKLKATRELSAIGEWFWSIHDEQFIFDAVGAVLIGVEPVRSSRSDSFRVDDWESLVHPNDTTDVENYLHCIKAGLKEPELVLRVLRPDGEERIIRASGANLERDMSGNPIGVRGLMRDITESYSTRQQLMDEIEQLKSQLNRKRPSA